MNQNILTDELRPTNAVNGHAAANGSGRRHNDLYTTEDKLTAVLFENLPNDIIIKGFLCEPCAGPGRMAQAIRRRSNALVFTNDIDRRFDNTDFTSDAADPNAAVWQAESAYYDWVVTNPPFKVAADILFNSWNSAHGGVAMLLRVTFIEPTKKRGDWLQDHADHLRCFMPVSQPRPSFTSDGRTDSATTAWFVWLKNFSWQRDFGIPSPFSFVMGWR